MTNPLGKPRGIKWTLLFVSNLSVRELNHFKIKINLKNIILSNFKNVISNGIKYWRNPNSKNLIVGFGSVFSATMISNFVRVANIIVITRFYSKEEFGIWATITSTVAIIAMGGDLGIVNALRNKLSELQVKGPRYDQEAKGYFFSAFIFFLFMSLILIIILLILFYNIPFQSLFKTDNEFIRSQGKTILLYVQFLFFLGIPLSIGNASFFSYNEARFSGIFLIIQSVTSFLFILTSSILQQSIVFVSVGYFVVIQLINLLSLLYFIRRRKWLGELNKDIFDFSLFLKRIKYLFVNGIKFLGLQFSKGFLENAGTVIASSTLSLNIAAEFNLVQKLYTFGVGIYQSLFNPLWGAFSEKAEKNEWAWCKKAFILSIKVTSFVVPTITIILYFFGNFFLKILGGANYVTQPSLILILGLATFFYLLFTSVTTFQSAISKINFITSLMIFFSIIVFPVTKFIVKFHGVDGIAISLLLIWIISFIFGFYQSNRTFNKKLIQYGISKF